MIGTTVQSRVRMILLMWICTWIFTPPLPPPVAIVRRTRAEELEQEVGVVGAAEQEVLVVAVVVEEEQEQEQEQEEQQ